jgi:hypothetical protein
MECYDAMAKVSYPRHAEYVGPRPDLAGRCYRCMEVIDAQLAAAGAAAQRRAEAEVAADAARRPRFKAGDTVTCLDDVQGAHFLHVGKRYVVDHVQGDRVSLRGMARAWETWRFRLAR